MNVTLNEITVEQVIGLNRSAIQYSHSINSSSQQKHAVIKLSDLKGCIGGIFHQLHPIGYVHLPIEKMAGLLLYRIAQGQYFLDGNKRTALLAMKVFLSNNGHQIRIERKVVSELIWGFAVPFNSPDPKPRFQESDSIQWVFDNILPALPVVP